MVWFLDLHIAIVYLLFGILFSFQIVHFFHWIGPLGHRIAMSLFLFVMSQNSHFRVKWRPLIKECIPNIGLWWHIFWRKKGVAECFIRLLKCAVLDQPSVDIEGVSRGRSLALAVGFLLFALPWHFHGTSKTKTKQKEKWYQSVLHRSRDLVSLVCKNILMYLWFCH